MEEELPDDFDDASDQYIAIPHKNALDLGANLALEFAAESMRDQYGRIEGYLRLTGKSPEEVFSALKSVHSDA
jgi:hypothetical protein